MLLEVALSSIFTKNSKMEGAKIKSEPSNETELEFDPIEIETEAKIKIEQESNCQDPLGFETKLLGNISIKIENDILLCLQILD